MVSHDHYTSFIKPHTVRSMKDCPAVHRMKRECDGHVYSRRRQKRSKGMINQNELFCNLVQIAVCRVGLPTPSLQASPSTTPLNVRAKVCLPYFEQDGWHASGHRRRARNSECRCAMQLLTRKSNPRQKGRRSSAQAGRQ